MGPFVLSLSVKVAGQTGLALVNISGYKSVHPVHLHLLMIMTIQTGKISEIRALMAVSAVQLGVPAGSYRESMVK